MLLKLAKAAGVAAAVLVVLMFGLDADAAAGGPPVNRAIHTLMLELVCVLATAYFTQGIVEAVVAEHRSDPHPFDDQALRVVIKAEVGAVFSAELESALAEVYRLGMVAGAQRVNRIALVPPIREGD